MSDKFRPSSPDDVLRLIASHPLCWLVTHTHATPLPLIAGRAPDGGPAFLDGHMALANEQVVELRRDPRVRVLATGPQGYISPALVPQSDWAPTWNYAVAIIHGTLTFMPDATGTMIERLSAALHPEGDPWTVTRIGPRYDGMLQHIVGFRISVDRIDARFKLGQDESDANFHAILANHHDDHLTRWMRAARS